MSGRGLLADKSRSRFWFFPFSFDPLSFVPDSVIKREAERSNTRKRGVGMPRAAIWRQADACENFLAKPRKPFLMGL